MQAISSPLIKRYPVGQWTIGGLTCVVMLIPTVITALSGAYVITLGFLPFLLLGGFLLATGRIFMVNDQVVVIMTFFTRNQLGWDEVEKIEVSGRGALIVLHAATATPAPKWLVIPGPLNWGGSKKQISAIFARQSKQRQIAVQEVPGLGRSFSSRTSQVSTDSPDPQSYVAAPPKIFPETNAYAFQTDAAAVPQSLGGEPGPQLGGSARDLSNRERAIQASLRQKQGSVNMLSGFIGGALAAVFGAIIWAAVAFFAHYEFGFISIGVGLIVGYSTRAMAGHGNPAVGLMSGGLSMGACMLGGVLAAIAIVAQNDPASIGFLNYFVISFTHPDILLKIFGLVFDPLDMLFYLIAIYNGYHFGSR